MVKKYIDENVLDAAKKRISICFDKFKHIYISFSGGKDSTVMTHLVMEEAIKRNRKVGLFFLDWECQFTHTIAHVEEIYKMYQEHIVPLWVAIPIKTWNGCSQIEPEWTCWEKGKEKLWVREKNDLSIRDGSHFYFYKENMYFEEFTPKLSKWFSIGNDCCNFIGIRTQESLNRYRTLALIKKDTIEDFTWTTRNDGNTWNAYPIYDWQTEDIWTYHAKTGKPYNKLYDRMYQAGVSLHKMRIDEPFGNTQKVGLWMYQIVEPELWAKMCARVSGANTGNIYANETGNIMGHKSISLPEGHTWKSFSNFLLETMPTRTAEHYRNKFLVYLHWYESHGYPDGIPDTIEGDLGSHDIPSWRRVCKTLLKNDYWCKTLNFSPTKTDSYDRYLKMMNERKKKWSTKL